MNVAEIQVKTKWNTNDVENSTRVLSDVVSDENLGAIFFDASNWNQSGSSRTSVKSYSLPTEF